MKRKRLLSGILGILLVFGVLLVTACPTDIGGTDNNSGNNNNNGDNNNGNSNADNRGFLEILYGSGGGNTDEGVYVGIISFAGDATVITDPVRLDASGYATLKSKIANNYTRATTGSTTMFLAVHKALAELKAKENTYPANLDTVSIITFTDGLDNQSLAMLANPLNSSGPNYHLEGQFYVLSDTTSEGKYMDYVKGQIDSRKIANKTIKAYAVGVQGSDVKDTALFEASLPKIASTGTDESGIPYLTKLTDFADLKRTFQSIANGLNVTHTSVNIVMTTTQSSAGTKYRWTFDAAGGNSAENSAKYIEATIAIDDNSGAYSLKDITYAGGITTAQGSGPLAGTAKTAGNVDFTFTDVTGYDPDTDQKPKQWIKRSSAGVFGPESEITSTGNADRTVEYKTAIIYLVLDASTSLSEANISSIKSAISSGSSSPSTPSQPSTGVPSAPTGVEAKEESSSSIALSWNSVSGASYYKIYRSTSSSGSYSSLAESYSTTYTDTGVSPNTTYYYRVSAVNNAGESSQSAYAYATTSGEKDDYDGSSSDTAITLSPGDERSGTLSSNYFPEVWYCVTVYSGEAYYVWGSSDSGIVVTLYEKGYDGDMKYLGNITIDYFGGEDLLPSSSGTYYIKVSLPDYSDYSGYSIGISSSYSSYY
ncbi:MAG: VWA domain-containing protein [Treponema sp.]|jgi:hypothetical protein|nr:VWA domain-containing protein [Treponema sp.]